jgi:hypothetical protein
MSFLWVSYFCSPGPHIVAPTYAECFQYGFGIVHGGGRQVVQGVPINAHVHFGHQINNGGSR